ncbi:MAG: transposase [Planctomycetaceae bacterium]|nr:transposase [Planctomycetaceae bacterium]
MNANDYKTIKHFDKTGDVHELTFSYYHQMALLINDDWRKMLAESITRATIRHRYKLIAFVFMPDHEHLLVCPEMECSPISNLLKAIKRPFSYRVKEYLKKGHNSLLNRLTIQQRPGVNTFRFWQEGPGYDRNITDEKTLLAAIQYIHENPVKRNLCRQAIDWKWSSAKQYLVPNAPADKGLPKLDRLPLNLSVPE